MTVIAEKSKAFAQSGAVLVALGVGILFVSAQIEIPIGPVPITLQTAVVAIIGLTYRKSLAVSSVAIYLLLGALGAPVFSGFGGSIVHMLGTSGGYLMGFLPAVWVMSSLVERFRAQRFLALSAIALVGTAVIFTCGLAWLSRFFSFSFALQMGLFPFIVPGLVKALVTALSVRYLKRP